MVVKIISANGLVLAEVGVDIAPKPNSSTNACYSTKVS
jgi:hypothetical protein